MFKKEYTKPYWKPRNGRYAKLPIHKNREMPKPYGRGLSGKSHAGQLLRRMEVGDSVWDIPANIVYSIKTRASMMGYKLMVRRIPDSRGLYAVKRTQ